MKRDDWLILVFFLLLLLAALITIFKGGEGSRHGYGAQLIKNDLAHIDFV